jgi:carbonic anhydrase
VVSITWKGKSVSQVPNLLAANQNYATLFHRSGLPLAPRLKLAVLVCMDSRIDIFNALGLKNGDAHVIRNAGGRAGDALRSLAVSHRLLGTREIVVIHHTDCGLLNTSNADIQRRIGEEAGPEAEEAASAIDFLPFTDLDQSVRDDMAILKSSPLISSDVIVSGFVFDVETGRLRHVD